jgi:putative toxin-antitoxin system antitoxin component (TIGR02293 family)
MKTKKAITSKHRLSPARRHAEKWELLSYWAHDGFRTIKAGKAKLHSATTRRSAIGSSLGLAIKRRTTIIQILRKGLPVSSFEHLRQEIDVTLTELASVTSIAMRTLARRKKEGRFQLPESERVFRIGALFDKATEVLGDAHTARQWFKNPKKALEGKSPLEYADTEIGAREVEDLLGRLEYGVFS